MNGTDTELPAPRAPRRRTRRKRSGGAAAALFAHGEPLVWLTGGCQALCLAMVILLLALVLVRGLETFWPSPVARMALADGKTWLGEQTREEDYRLSREMFSDVPESVRRTANLTFEPDGTTAAHRRLYRTGNFEITNAHFRWISDFAVVQRSLPKWALTIERVKNGRFYGEPEALLEVEAWDPARRDKARLLAADPETQVLVSRAKGYAHERIRLRDMTPQDEPTHLVLGSVDGAAEAWTRFGELHGAARERFAERERLEKEDLGDLSRRLDEARLAVTEARLAHGAASSEERAAEQSRADLQQELQAETDRILARIAALSAENARHALLVRTCDGRQKALGLADIVRAYPANQLSFVDKLRVYFSRWWEFLSADPREANREGGVLPAIFGTVVMTLIMCIAVVPFGVLAALYLREYAKPGPIVSAVRISVNNLAGVPSIVFGVFGLGFFCYGIGKYIDGGPAQGLGFVPWERSTWLLMLGVMLLVLVAAILSSIAASARSAKSRARGQKLWGRVGLLLWLAASALALALLAKTPFFDGFFRAKLEESKPTYGTGGLLWASLTLALLTLPVVIVATEEALAAVPNSMREGSYACGASKWQTIRRIVLPRAMPGIMTGMILAMARGAGEVAPLMLVGAVKLAPELPLDGIFPFIHGERSFMHLGFHIYDAGFQSQDSESAKPMVFTTTLLLILIIAALNVAAVWLRARLKRRFVTGQF